MFKYRHLILAPLTLAAASHWAPDCQAQGSSVSFTGPAYTQNFDSLPYTPGTDVNTSNPVTLNGTQYTFNGSAYSSNASAAGTFDFAAPIDSSGTVAGSTGGLGLSSTMSGWYGGAVTLIKAGAQSGTQTTGGILSFGTTGGGALDANRSLGLLATGSTGITFFGLKLINNTGATINQISYGFTGDLWRQTTTAKALNYGYFVDPTVTDTLPMLTMAGAQQVGSLSFAAGTTTTTTTAANTTGPISTTPGGANGLALNTPWTNGSALWLVFQEATNAGGSQGIGIDNLTFTVPQPVPEPGTYAIVALGLAGLALLARCRAKLA